MKKPLFILVGPTSVGKTEISIKLAHIVNGEIISADSMQIYRHMDIGTAKPEKEEMNGIKHHLIDVVNPDEDFSVAVFRELAGKCIDNILNRKKLPMVVGGTGLYINSLIYNYDFTQTVSDWEYRKTLSKLADTYGNSYIHNMLKNVDLESYNRLHPNDRKRIIRALEVFAHTGKTISEFQKQSKDKPIEYELCVVGLIMDRQKLYERINLRVDKMIEKGLVKEVSNLLDMGYSSDLTSMQGLGYKEIVSYLKGECPLEEAIDKLKQSTRHFAKRQLTWFRREARIHWINIDDFNNNDDIVENIANYIAGKLSSV